MHNFDILGVMFYCFIAGNLTGFFGYICFRGIKDFIKEVRKK